MSSSDSTAVLENTVTSADDTALADTCAQLEQLAAAGGTSLPHEAVQRIFTAACRLFADQALTGEVGEPFTPGANVNATDVMVVASTMLRQQNLEVFELGLWQSFGGQPWIK